MTYSRPLPHRFSWGTHPRGCELVRRGSRESTNETTVVDAAGGRILVGSLGMAPTDYGEIFRMVDTGKLDPGAVVSETVTLDDVSDRLAAMSDFGTMGIPVIDEFA